MSSRRSALPWVPYAVAFLTLAGCGEGAYEKLRAPDQENVRLIRNEYSSDAEGAAEKANPFEGRTEAAWASLNVSVVLEGSTPAPEPLNISRDTSVCAPGGGPVFDNAIAVGPNNSLANVLLYLNTSLPENDADAEQPLWVHSRYSIANNPELAEVLFDQEDCLFVTPVFAMRADQTLIIKNSDRTGHNTKLNTTKANPLNASIEAKDSITYTPGAEERNPFKVECSIHPWMGAYMITRNNPYFGVSRVKQQGPNDAQPPGQFTIADIPAGIELEYRIWVVRDFANPATTKLTLNGQPLEMKRAGKLKMNLEAREAPHELKIAVNSAAFAD